MRWQARAKGALFRLADASGAAQPAWRGRALVVAYHTVNDRHDTPISVSVERFERSLDWLASSFTVIRLEELVDRLRCGRDISRCAAITFDDGYLDNRTIAAPLLAARGMPATFFIASGFIGSTHQTAWDTDHRVQSEWMTWQHVRELHEMGFTLGGHTTNHIDLGTSPLEDVRADIVRGLDLIEDATGTRPTMFAYPYGRRDAITDAARALVGELGLQSCCSCFGGVVRANVSPMRLQRIAYSQWFASPEQYGLEATRLAAVREPVRPSRHP